VLPVQRAEPARDRRAHRVTVTHSWMILKRLDQFARDRSRLELLRGCDAAAGEAARGDGYDCSRYAHGLIWGLSAGMLDRRLTGSMISLGVVR